MKELKTTKDIYKNSVKDLQKDLGFDNAMMVPKITKIVVNAGIGKISKESDKVNEVVKSLKEITGQSPVKTKTKKAIAGFKVREGMPVGIRVTLRGEKMYNFYDRLVSIALPRVKDFRGVPRNGFDGRGNYNFGLQEQLIFPEISYDSNPGKPFRFDCAGRAVLQPGKARSSTALSTPSLPPPG